MSWWLPAGTDHCPDPVLIAPSILSADAANLEAEIHAMTRAGADWVHVDVMDGHFVENLSYGPHVTQCVKKITDLPLDCHLMVSDPAHFIPPFIRAGADILTFHIEAEADHAALLRQIRKEGVRSGLVINPSTPLKPEFRDLLPLCDMVLVMSVHPGYSGQSFDPSVLSKLRTLAGWRDEMDLDLVLEIDGGIDPQTAPSAREAGARILVSGSTLFASDDPARTIRILKGIEAAG